MEIALFSSREGEGLLRAVNVGLAQDGRLRPRPWRGMFRGGEVTIDSIVAALNRAEFAAILLAADDIRKVRGRTQWAPRDNLVFEAGLAIGILGRRRALLLAPRDRPIALPSDMLGIVLIQYESNPAAPSHQMDDAVRGVLVATRGRRTRFGSGRSRTPPPKSTTRRWPEGGSLEILSARYGQGPDQRKWIGAMPPVEKSKVNNAIRLLVSNETMGGDPHAGVPKSLEVSYSIGGVDGFISVPEGEELILPPPA